MWGLFYFSTIPFSTISQNNFTFCTETPHHVNGFFLPDSSNRLRYTPH